MLMANTKSIWVSFSSQTALISWLVFLLLWGRPINFNLDLKEVHKGSTHHVYMLFIFVLVKIIFIFVWDMQRLPRLLWHLQFWRCSDLPSQVGWCQGLSDPYVWTFFLLSTLQETTFTCCPLFPRHWHWHNNQLIIIIHFTVAGSNVLADRCILFSWN